MSVCDLIVVMKEGVVQQVGEPQQVYDDPRNLFVARFLGTPPINLFSGRAEGGTLFIGEEAVMDIGTLSDRELTVAVRPEGFTVDPDGPLTCTLERVEVMGRDISIISKHQCSQSGALRSIVSAESLALAGSAEVRFSLKRGKVFLFDARSGERVYF